ncbi:MAG: hypothetical protein DHS20C18_40670 [Saprospiraceae bacterium]|nr:MAG: hypothetical protein DHS20C18_40670 [Saprospiraceae bacterium]
MSTVIRFLALIGLILIATSFTSTAQSVSQPYPTGNGFSLDNLELPISEIYPGGPARNGITSLNDPKFEPASCAEDFVSAQDYVIGISYNGVTRAYPVKIMGYHEVVNDQIGEEKILVTYSPLTGSTLVFSAPQENNVQTFGVSGLVYNNNSLLYDQATESLWSQFTGMAISGSEAGQRMKQIPTTYTTWAQWKELHPATEVLSTDTGFKHTYDQSPYLAYGNNSKTMFPVSFKNRILPTKSQVVGVEVNGRFKAYPFALLPNGKDRVTDDNFNGQQIRIEFNADTRTAVVTDGIGNVLPSVTSYWFAWYGFHPETEVYGFLPERSPLAMLEIR